MTNKYTPTNEEIREYIELADRATAHMFSPEAPDTAEAFDRWLASVKAETLRKTAKLGRGADSLGVESVPAQWLIEEADRIERGVSGA